MSDVYIFSDLYDRAVRQFGEPAGEALEEQLLRAFNDDPKTITFHVEYVIGRHRDGDIHHPWGMLRAKLVSIAGADGDLRARMVRNAEIFVERAGRFYPNAAELEDDLFVRGPLRAWQHDVELVSHFTELWQGYQPPPPESYLDDPDSSITVMPAAPRVELAGIAGSISSTLEVLGSTVDDRAGEGEQPHA